MLKPLENCAKCSLPDHVVIPVKALALLTQEGYFKRYYELLAEGRPCRKCYELVEAELYGYFRIYRYSEYQSFKVRRGKYLRGKMKSKPG
jgi:hypothetical protein